MPSLVSSLPLVAGLVGAGTCAHVATRRYARRFLEIRPTRAAPAIVTPGDAFRIELPTPLGTLRGWWLRAAHAPRPTVVLAHGWQSHAVDMLPWARPLVAAGFHAVVYDALGHGSSDPAELTSLRHLRDDLHRVLAWVAAHPLASPGVALLGHSMGGAAAALVTAGAPPTHRPRALVLAGAPTDALRVTREWLERKRMPGALVVRLLAPYWQRLIGERYDALQPLPALRAARVPALVLHGDADRHVGVHHAHALAEAAGGELVLVPGGRHHDLPEHAPYREHVPAFLARAFAA